MAYTLNSFSGTITVTDGTLNTASTSLALPGRNYAGYGQPVDQNMVYLTENFAYFTSGPSNPLKGQIWFDTTNTLLKYNTGTPASPVWASLYAIGAALPSLNLTGDLTTTGNVYANTGIVQGNYVVSLTNHVYATATGLTATGSSQGTALALTKDINVVSTVSASTGVSLPATPPSTTTGGLRISIINTGLNSLNVYPASGAQINSLGTNVPYSLATGARLDFLSVSSTQWYTLNATYS